MNSLSTSESKTQASNYAQAGVLSADGSLLFGDFDVLYRHNKLESILTDSGKSRIRIKSKSIFDK